MSFLKKLGEGIVKRVNPNVEDLKEQTELLKAKAELERAKASIDRAKADQEISLFKKRKARDKNKDTGFDDMYKW